MPLSDRSRAIASRHYTDPLADELESLARVVALMDSTESAARLLRRRAVQIKTLHIKRPH
jgi:hypothetical protein